MDKMISGDRLTTALSAGHIANDMTHTIGIYVATFRDATGRVYHEEEFPNLLTTLGKNFLLDTTLAGSAYTVTGPFMGLISSVSWSAVSAADTAGSHAGWLEANATNAPPYGATRPTCVWSAASAGVKALSTGLVYTFTNSGTVQGAFIVLGSGATSSNTTVNGTLYSAGALGTPQPVISSNTLTLTYSTTLT